MSRCSTCRAEITWVKTAAGKSMPLDAEPTEDGNVVLVNGLAVVLHARGAEGVAAVGATRYTPHWATCPQSAQHRRNGR